MDLSPLLRWGSIISLIAALGLAISFQLQQPLTSLTSPGGGAQATYCYRGVRTHDKSDPSPARCFSVRDGLVSRVWREGESPTTGGDLHQSDGYAIPGLWDGHGHLLEYGQFLHSVDLFGSRSLDEVRERIKAYVRAHPGVGTAREWIRGIGWDQAFFGRMPIANDLEDDELHGLYILLDRIDGHCVLVSNPVLALLPPDMPDVPGGEIIRDPPGMGVFCDLAVNPILAHYPKPGRAAKARFLRSAMAKLNEVGLVGMHDAGTVPDDIRLYAERAGSEDWTVRVYAMRECAERNTFCPEDAVKIQREDSMLIVRSVKLFADGALGSWGSAMIEPYDDHPWSVGSLLINASSLTALTKQWAAAGFQVNVHAIGDLANRNVVDAFEAALRQECPASASDNNNNDDDDDDDGRRLAACQAKHRFRIEHAQIIHPDDQRRLHALGLLPSIQPTHATSDMRYAIDRLGPRRARREAYLLRSLLDMDPILGSDFPVEPPNPFRGIYAAVARKEPSTGRGPDPEDPFGKGFLTDEALALDEALWGFSGATAYGAFLEGKAGVIKEGSFADWVVLDEPIEEINIEKLRSLTVRETWVAGRKVYERPH